MELRRTHQKKKNHLLKKYTHYLLGFHRKLARCLSQREEEEKNSQKKCFLRHSVGNCLWGGNLNEGGIYRREGIKLEKVGVNADA